MIIVDKLIHDYPIKMQHINMSNKLFLYANKRLIAYT